MCKNSLFFTSSITFVITCLFDGRQSNRWGVISHYGFSFLLLTCMCPLHSFSAWSKILVYLQLLWLSKPPSLHLVTPSSKEEDHSWHLDAGQLKVSPSSSNWEKVLPFQGETGREELFICSFRAEPWEEYLTSVYIPFINLFVCYHSVGPMGASPCVPCHHWISSSSKCNRGTLQVLT